MDSSPHSIRALQAGDMPAFTELYANRFGTTESITLSDESLADLSNDPLNGCDVYVATDSDDVVIGLIVGVVIPPTALEDWLGVSIRDFPTSPTSGFVQAVAVDTEWENQGVASALLSRLLERFADIGAEQVYAVSWQRRNDVDSSRLFESFEFNDLRLVEYFYARDVKPRTDCPDCNTPACACNGRIYQKTL